MKKSCNGCRANSGDTGSCDLGYKVKKLFSQLVPKQIPVEECEKPKTYSEYLYLREIKRSNTQP